MHRFQLFPFGNFYVYVTTYVEHHSISAWYKCASFIVKDDRFQLFPPWKYLEADKLFPFGDFFEKIFFLIFHFFIEKNVHLHVFKMIRQYQIYTFT